jgi:aspartyl/glutamyl-tRNA(Asn/Gln) amidotransferase C subunit
MPPANFDIQPLASLSRLHLTDPEKSQLSDNLRTTIALFSHLEARTTDSADVANAASVESLRPDVVLPSLPSETALNAAPYRQGDFFVVPAVKASRS